MKNVITILVYGDFAKKDIRLKFFEPNGTLLPYQFQNILRDAGYDAELYSVNDTDIPWTIPTVPAPTEE